MTDYLRTLRVRYCRELAEYYGRPARQVHWLQVLDFVSRTWWRNPDELKHGGIPGA